LFFNPFNPVQKFNLRVMLKHKPFLIFLTLLMLTGCNSNDDSSSSSETSPNRFTLSGSIFVASNTAKDSDVNDVNTSERSNNSEYSAQRISNPVILGGYVNQPGNGPSGSFKIVGDQDDFFEVDLRAGQTIALFVANQNLGYNDLDLGLIKSNADGTTSIVDASVGEGKAGETEMLVVPSDGRYFVQVQAYKGASNYILSIGQNLSVTTHGMRLSDDFFPGDVVVKFASDGILQAQSATTALGMHTKSIDTSRRMLFSLDPNQSRLLTATRQFQFVSPEHRLKYETLMAIKQLRKRADIIEASPNYRLSALRVPNDPNYRYQWNHPLIKLAQAWDTTIGDPNIIVAVVDSGVLLRHPDLRGNIIQGYDFISNVGISLDGDGLDPDPSDPGEQFPGGGSFHGSHVAGTIAAVTNNDNGIAGVAWLTKLMPLRVTGEGGAGYDYDISQAIRYAAGLPNDSRTVPARRADIINLSLGGPAVSNGFQELMNEVRDAGVIVVAAAGNEDNDVPFFPAALDGVISVSAVNINKRRASYSNYGYSIDVAAPGGDNTPDINGDGMPDGIISTVGNEVGDESGRQTIEFTFRPLEGTSMAAPHVSGVISLMKAVNPNLTPQDVDALLSREKITDDLGHKGRDDDFGYGLINAQKAVLAAIEVSGEMVPQPLPQLVVTPRALNFGLNRTSATVTLSNGGGEELYIENISVGAGEFLSWEGSSLGDYIIKVDRSHLTTGTYTSTITITSNVNVVKIPVILQVGDPNITGDAGLHYILLIDPDTLETQETRATVKDGVYHFRFDNIAKGTYIIVAGSDFNNDGFICDAGEACGAFFTLDRPTSLDINAYRGNIDFSTGFNVNFLSKTTTAVGIKSLPQGFARPIQTHRFQ